MHVVKAGGQETHKCQYASELHGGGGSLMASDGLFLISCAQCTHARGQETHPSDSELTGRRARRRELHDDELFARTVSMKEAGEGSRE